LGNMIGALVVTPVVVLWALSDVRAFSRSELTKSSLLSACENPATCRIYSSALELFLESTENATREWREHLCS
jgi:hypothetical protein